MKKIALLLLVFALLSACASGQVQQKTIVIHYKPVSYEITLAQGVEAPDILVPAIKTKIREYIDDKNYWNKNSKSVDMTIKITHVETASRVKFGLIGSLAPPGIVAADVILSADNKQVEYYKISAKRTESFFFGQALWADMNDNMAKQFVLDLMDAIQRPYDD